MGEIAVLLGGRAAEEIVREDVSTGAGNDLERATDLGRKMVCDWGMSEKLGPLTFGKKEEQIFLGREIAQHRDYSEDTAIKIDQEVRRIVMENYERAKKLLSENLDLLHRLAKELLDREVLDNNEIEKIMNGNDPIGEGSDKEKVRELRT
jgi:cell division protease FtsH